MNTKLLLGLITKLLDLLGYEEKLYFLERPFLLDDKAPRKTVHMDSKRKQIELEIRKVCEAIQKLEPQQITVKTVFPTQQEISDIFGV